MKAIVYNQYGNANVLMFDEIEKPQPKNTEILVKVHTSTVSAAVIWMRKGKHPSSKLFTFLIRLMYGITKPRNKVLGAEFSGVVEAIGENVKQFKVGDNVYGTTTGLKQGAYAQYICVPENWSQGVVALKPDGLTHEEAAALPIGSMTALHLLNKTLINKDQSILIYGASGSVGTYAVQLAKYFGGIVTAVCSTKNIELVKSIGANSVIDYTKTQITECENKFDIIFDAVGKLPSSTFKPLLKKEGRFVSVKSITMEKTKYLHFIEKIIDDGRLKPIIDKVYPLENIVKANEYVELGHKQGNVVISINPSSNKLANS